MRRKLDLGGGFRFGGLVDHQYLFHHVMFLERDLLHLHLFGHRGFGVHDGSRRGRKRDCRAEGQCGRRSNESFVRHGTSLSECRWNDFLWLADEDDPLDLNGR